MLRQFSKLGECRGETGLGSRTAKGAECASCGPRLNTYPSCMCAFVSC